jgi:hypothetical protein
VFDLGMSELMTGIVRKSAINQRFQLILTSLAPKQVKNEILVASW